MSTIRIVKKEDIKNELPTLSDLDYNIQKYTEEFSKKVKEKDSWIKSKAERAKAQLDACDLLERIKVCYIKRDYVDKKVDDSSVVANLNNIKTYTEGTQEFDNVFMYYSNKINMIPSMYYSEEKFKNRSKYIQYSATETSNLYDNGLDLKKYVKYRGPVVVAQEYFGSGVICKARSWVTDTKGKLAITQPEFDAYDDRITKIYYDAGTDKIIIQEFYRANVDVSIRYDKIVKPRLEGKADGGKSTHAGAFDFIVHNFLNQTALRLFHYETIWKLKESRFTKNIYEHYVNNSFPKIQEGFGPAWPSGTRDGAYNLTQEQDDYVTTKDIDEGKKQFIVVHRGNNDHTLSEGCLTIVEEDFKKFISTFEMFKLGMLFLFRDELLTK